LPVAGPAVTHPERQGTLPTVDRVNLHWRADVAGPADAGGPLQPRVVLGHVEQALGRVQAALDPVRSTGEGQVAVAVDHAGHHGAAGGVDDLGVTGVGFVTGGADPGDPVVLDQDAHAQAELRAGAVGEGGV